MVIMGEFILEINNIANIQSIKSIQTQKPKINQRISKFVADTYESRVKYQNTPQMGSTYNIAAFDKKFSDEQINSINETRELPDGYLLKYKPKQIVHQYENGVYIGDRVTPPLYSIVKEGSKQFFSNGSEQYLKILPDDYKVMNDEKCSYIVKKEETIDTLKQKQKTIISRLKLTVTAIAGVASFLGLKSILNK